jgi:hypothetical protein
MRYVTVAVSQHERVASIGMYVDNDYSSLSGRSYKIAGFFGPKKVVQARKKSRLFN